MRPNKRTLVAVDEGVRRAVSVGTNDAGAFPRLHLLSLPVEEPYRSTVALSPSLTLLLRGA
jgi:hypothetical protein